MSGFRVNQASGHIIEAKRQCKGAVDIEEQCRKAECVAVPSQAGGPGTLGFLTRDDHSTGTPTFFPCGLRDPHTHRRAAPKWFVTSRSQNPSWGFLHSELSSCQQNSTDVPLTDTSVKRNVAYRGEECKHSRQMKC